MKKFTYQSSLIFKDSMILLPVLAIFCLVYIHYKFDERLMYLGYWLTAIAVFLFICLSYLLAAKIQSRRTFILDDSGITYINLKWEKHLRWDEVTAIEKDVTLDGKVVAIHSKNYKPIKMVVDYIASEKDNPLTIDELYETVQSYREKGLSA